MQKTCHIKKYSPMLVGYIAIFLIVGIVSIENASAQGSLNFTPTQQAIENSPALNNLLFGVNSSVHISTGGVSLSSNEVMPLVAYCDADAFNQLYLTDAIFASVKALYITVSDSPANATLDLTLLSSFTQLEYINIDFTYEACGNMTSTTCLLPLVQQMIQLGNTPMNVFYQLVIPQ